MAAPSAPLSRFAEVCSALEATRSRLEKRRLIVAFLRVLPAEDVAPAALLLIGRPFSEADERVLRVGWSTLSKAVEGPRQTTLAEEPLTLREVREAFERIAAASGSDSVNAKRRLLTALLSRASEDERHLLMRTIFGEMRTGVNEGVLLEALADAAAVKGEVVRRAHMFSGDLGRVANAAVVEGESGLRRFSFQLFTPLQPMMAEMAESLEEVLREHGGRSAFEFKFDGARVQIHRRGGEVRIFSRRLTDVTASLPEVAAWARSWRSEEFVVEGEVVGVDAHGKPVPFQDLMRRFRRVHDIEAAQKVLPVRLYLFDMLYRDGSLLIDETYEVRWRALEEVVPSEFLARRIVMGDATEAARLFDEAIAAGHEGLMAKDLNSPYTPGSRGRRWFKVKPAETLDVVLIAAEWGHGRRTGTLSNYHLGVRDGKEFAMIGKTFKGLTDEERRAITERLQGLAVEQERWGVRVRPEIVAEVAYNEIQKSPHYRSGFALRFARIARLRDDKGPADVDTLERLRDLYARQFERKGRAGLVDGQSVS